MCWFSLADNSMITFTKQYLLNAWEADSKFILSSKCTPHKIVKVDILWAQYVNNIGYCHEKFKC